MLSVTISQKQSRLPGFSPNSKPKESPKDSLSDQLVEARPQPSELSIKDVMQAMAKPTEKSDLELVSDIFAERFSQLEHYDPRGCGANVKGLIQAIHDVRPKALEGAKVVAISDNHSLFRHNKVRRLKINGEPYLDDSNFYHHVVFEKEGKIMDMTFGLEPEILDVPDYVEQMYFGGKGLWGPVSDEKKKETYKIRLIDAKDYLTKADGPSEEMSLGSWLNSAES